MILPDDEALPLNLFTQASPATLRVVSNTRITPPSGDDVRHIVLDRCATGFHYREGQSLAIVIPVIDERGHINKLRYYSIASARQGDDGGVQTLSICVKRIFTNDPATGERKPGVASNWLCDLQPGDRVNVTGPAGKHFVLPDDPRANLILVATGTGVAPYRAFLAHIFRERSDWTGQVYLFAGSKNQGECLYRDEFEAYRSRSNFIYIRAHSREEQTPRGERMYVDHRMAERVAEVWALLDHESTLLYICGIRGMEDRIFNVLESQARADGISWHAFHRALLDTGRLLVETY